MVYTSSSKFSSYLVQIPLLTCFKLETTLQCAALIYQQIVLMTFVWGKLFKNHIKMAQSIVLYNVNKCAFGKLW